MSKITIKDIDNILEEINNDIEKMNGNKDIRKNVSRYNLNMKKIQECQEVIIKTQTEIENLSEDENSSDELISDNQFLNYLNELDELKKQLTNGTSIKISEALDIYFKNLSKINKCKDYLENQKIEINHID